MLMLTFPSKVSFSSSSSILLRLPVIFHSNNFQSTPTTSPSSSSLSCRAFSSLSSTTTQTTGFNVAFSGPPSKQRIENCLFLPSTGKRNVSTSSSLLKDEQGWFSKLSSNLMVRKIETGKDSHSRLLADSEAIYEMQIHDVKPDSMNAYLGSMEKFSKEVTAKDPSYELVGSWRVEIGDQDQVINIWRYKKGYPSASETQKLIRSDSSLTALLNDQTKYLRQRHNQFMMPFSFWGHPVPAERNSFYEMRSYVLKPGTMIEWGNNWARGINFRTNQVAGFFSQIGQLYMVHHIWHYEDLQARKDVREDSWTKPGWDEIVAYTVPLIRELKTRWMSANSFSPIR